MLSKSEVQYISNPKELPEVFIPLPEDWEERLSWLEKVGRLTGIQLGNIFIFEMPMGKTTWRIIGAEVVNATEISTTHTTSAKDEAL